MIRKTPFHERAEALNQTGLWSHWSGYLAAEKYQMAEKFEYFAIRNAVGMIDTSPLYKYRIEGTDAEKFLAGLLARDIRQCRPGQAHYTLWCDDGGYVDEDGVILRLSDNEFLLTVARPNLAHLENLSGGYAVTIEDVSEEIGALALQGPYALEVLKQLAPEVEGVGYFHLTPAKIGSAAVTVSRTGYTGDLGYEIWVDADDALGVWDAVFDAARPYGVQPCGQIALLMTRIEAGLVLIDVDFHASRFAWNDDQRTTPHELGMGWMLKGIDTDERRFIGKAAILRELSEGLSRWKTVGVMVDWQSWDRLYNERGLIPPKDHTPQHGGMMLYDDKLERIGYVPSFFYSPIIQRHIGLARVRPEHASVGSPVGLEVTIDHRYDVVDATVARLPFYNPPRKTQ
jgi:aminomethyltransferase